MPATTCPLPRSGRCAGLRHRCARRRSCSAAGSRAPASIDPDQWEWDGSAQTWTQRQITTAAERALRRRDGLGQPAQRAPCCSAASTRPTGRRQDTWEWNGTTWTDRTPAGTKPTARHSATDDLRLRSAGRPSSTAATPGRAATGGTWVDETWEWDGAAGTWTKITATALTSTQWGSGYTTLVYDAGTNKIVLFYSYSNGYTWVYTPGASDTGTWADVSPDAIRTDTSPTRLTTSRRSSTTPDAQVLVVFGGQATAARCGSSTRRTGRGRTVPRLPTAPSSDSTRRSRSTACAAS